MSARLAFALLALAAAMPAPAAPPAGAVRAEIDALLGALASSGCRFQRNGSWHTAAEARDHLRQKLSVIEARGALASAEQFISTAASGSSLSGKPYIVRCGDAAEVTSAEWLNSRLRALRAGGESARNAR